MHGHSASIGSFTLTTISAFAHTSAALGTSVPPATLYASSTNPQPTPAPCSTSTLCPSPTSDSTPAGTSATRCSAVLISFGTPAMIVGVPKEIKTAEHRVALVPAGVESLVGDGHSVLVEHGAGIGAGVADDADGGAGEGRDGGQGEGADRGRVAVHAQGSGRIHLLPLRGVGAAHAGGDQVGDRRDRVRDGTAALGGPPLAHADERGGGADGGAGGGEI